MATTLTTLIEQFQAEAAERQGQASVELVGRVIGSIYKSPNKGLIMLSGINLTESSIELVSSSLLHEGQLRALHLNAQHTEIEMTCALQNLQISPEVWNLFCTRLQEAMSQINGLCPEFIATNNQITDQIAAIIARNFPDLGVICLHLGFNQLTSIGARQLIENNPKLERVDFSYNRIDSEFAEFLVEYIRGGRLKLDYLDLSHNSLTDENKKEICQALSDARSKCEVILGNSVQEQKKLLLLHRLDSRESGFEHRFTKSILIEVAKTIREEHFRIAEERLNQNRIQDSEGILRDCRYGFFAIGDQDRTYHHITLNKLRIIDNFLRHEGHDSTYLSLWGITWSAAERAEIAKMIIELIRDNHSLKYLAIPSEEFLLEEFREFITIIATHPTLQEIRLGSLDFPNGEWAQRTQILATLFQHNTRIKIVHFTGFGPIPDECVAAIAHNHTIRIIGGSFPTQPNIVAFLQRNKGIPVAPITAKVNAIRAVYQGIPHEELTDERREDIQFPRLKALAQDQLKSPLRQLLPFVSDEINRLTPRIHRQKHTKGMSDKSALYRQLEKEIDELLKTDLTQLASEGEHDWLNHFAERSRKMIRETAIVAHHRRYSFWNTLASVFNKKYKQAESWRRFKEKFNANQENKALISLFDTKKRKAVACFDQYGREHFVRSYNRYRQIKLGR